MNDEARHSHGQGGWASDASVFGFLLLMLGVVGFALLSRPYMQPITPPSAISTAWVVAAAAPPAGAEKPKEAAEKPRDSDHVHEEPSMKVLHWEGLHNVVHFAEDLYSGSSPETPEAFASLARRGIKTIVSVDGAPPLVALAKAAGIRYVHIPVAYATITPEQQAQLARVAKERPKPIYLHCHHGKHRGPAAAAVLWRCNDGACTAAKSLELLKAAGTDPKYQGLYAVVEAFSPPASDLADSSKEELPPLPESVAPPALVDAMIDLDGVWDRWKIRQAAGWPIPIENYEKVREAAADATLLREQYEEMLRLPEADRRPAEFRMMLKAGREAAISMEVKLGLKKPLSPELRKKLQAELVAVGKTCSGCHAKFRDVVAK